MTTEITLQAAIQEMEQLKDELAIEIITPRYYEARMKYLTLVQKRLTK